jgi:hypothetical protein
MGYGIGIDWHNWTIGIQVHKTKYGTIIEIAFLPLQILISMDVDTDSYKKDRATHE